MAHLQYSRLQHCLSPSTCNIQASNVACHGPLAMFTAPTLLVTLHLQYYGPQCCLSPSTCNIRGSYLSCLVSLDKYNAPIYLVDPISIITNLSIHHTIPNTLLTPFTSPKKKVRDITRDVPDFLLEF